MSLSRSNGYKVTRGQSWRSKKKSTSSAITVKVCTSVWPRIEANLARNRYSQSLTDRNFVALDLLTDSILPLWKDLNPFQKAGSFLRIGFTLSNWHHFHGAYFVTVSM